MSTETPNGYSEFDSLGCPDCGATLEADFTDIRTLGEAEPRHAFVILGWVACSERTRHEHGTANADLVPRPGRNRSPRALGYQSEGDCARAMMRTHELADKLFDKIAWCHHHPKAEHPEMARCWCRKPAPGLLIESALALAEKHRGEIYPPYMALMVGDRPEDEECARIAGVDFQWAGEWREAS
jgi:hypothetical protein